MATDSLADRIPYAIPCRRRQDVATSGRSDHGRARHGNGSQIERHCPLPNRAGRDRHRVVRTADQNGERVLLARGDAARGEGEPVAAEQTLDKVIAVERDGRCIDLASRKAKVKHSIRVLALRCKRLIGFLQIAKRAKRAPRIRAAGRDAAAAPTRQWTQSGFSER